MPFFEVSLTTLLFADEDSGKSYLIPSAAIDTKNGSRTEITLGNQPLRYFIGGNKDCTTQVEYYGTKVNVGVKFSL